MQSTRHKKKKKNYGDTYHTGQNFVYPNREWVIWTPWAWTADSDRFALSLYVNPQNSWKISLCPRFHCVEGDKPPCGEGRYLVVLLINHSLYLLLFIVFFKKLCLLLCNLLIWKGASKKKIWRKLFLVDLVCDAALVSLLRNCR